MYGVLKQCPTPDIEDICNGLQGNLCRCTGYRPIIEAFQSFSIDKVDLKMREIPENVLSAMKSLSETAISFDSNICWNKPQSLDQVFMMIKTNPNYLLRAGGTGTYKKFQNKKHDVVIDISSIEELKTLSLTENKLIIGAGVTFTQLLNFFEKNDRTSSMLTTELYQVIKNLAAPQVRNVATLGGSLLWDHPGSDIIPFLLAAGASVVIATETDQKEIPLEQLIKNKIQNGELLKTIIVSTDVNVKFFKHARRKTADLAVANIALGFKRLDEKKINDVKIYIGGIGIAIKDCPQRSVIKAVQLEQILTESNIDEVTKESICSAVEADMRVDSSLLSNMDKIAFRVSLIIAFVLKFIEAVVKNDVTPSMKKTVDFKSNQILEKTPADQDPLDPVTRPIPHVSGAEQCTGQALYIDDLPRFERELLLFPVQSKVSNGLIKKVDVSAALAIPGVVAWISAKDVPGENLWSLTETPDEEVFASESVVYVGQIIGLIAAETREAGLAAVKVLNADIEVMDTLVSIEDAKAAKSTRGDD